MSPWFIARATGLTAYLAFSISVVVGLLLSSKLMGKRASKNLTTAHEAFSIAGFLLIPIHAIAILNDAVFHFTWRALLIPGASPYAPVAVGAGVVAGWLSLLVIASFYLRKKIKPRNWRRFHYITPVVYALMTAHGIMAGSDTSSPAAAALYTASIGVTVALLLYRILVPKPAPKKRARPGEAALDPGARA
ncbi:MAG TPA: hypothetical protein VFK89_04485 [Actinomycetota bacterium]|nr:hypothetical protein [Actinomycetota bacterium]